MSGHPNRAASGNSDRTLAWRRDTCPMSVPGSETAADLAMIAVRLDETDAAATTASGRSFPMGATVLAHGVNFAVFSRQASRVELLLFDDAEGRSPTRAIDLEARKHRTYHYWHVFVPGIRAGQLYGYRVTGPFAPEHGLRFDPSKVLLDPYGRAVAVPDGYSRQLASQYGVNDAIAMKSVVVDPSGYDWEGDAPLRRPIRAARSSTRCMSLASRGIRAQESPRNCAGPTRG